MTNLHKFLYIYYNPLHVHVSSNTLLILRRSNCITIAFGIVTLSKWPSGAPNGHLLSGRSQVWVGTAVPTQTWQRPVTTCVRKPEAANTVRAPDDERYAARNMLSLQWTVE